MVRATSWLAAHAARRHYADGRLCLQLPQQLRCCWLMVCLLLKAQYTAEARDSALAGILADATGLSYKASGAKAIWNVLPALCDVQVTQDSEWQQMNMT